MGKLDKMLNIFDKMDDLEKKLVYKLIGVFIVVILIFIIFGVIYLNYCVI